MEAAPNGPGIPKWNTFNYGMVCFYSIGLHASISLPYYLVKYSGKLDMHLRVVFCLYFAVLDYKSVLFQRDWRLSHHWCWIISCRKIDSFINSSPLIVFELFKHIVFYLETVNCYCSWKKLQFKISMKMIKIYGDKN